MEDILLFFGESNDADQTALVGIEISFVDANGDSVSLPVRLKVFKGEVRVDLYEGGSLVDKGIFVS